ncbi:MAG: hypothetical protein LBM21_02325 [Coriobacteriales bacterium]|nr:hypothetical protein [Coriobacteriales bacterium]
MKCPISGKVDIEPSDNVIRAWWLLIYIAIIALSAVIFYYVWPQIPNMVPNQIRNGVIIGYVQKGPITIGLPLGLEAMMAAVFTFVYLILRFTHRTVIVRGSRHDLVHIAGFRRAVSAFLLFICCIAMAFICAMFLLMDLSLLSAPVIVGMVVPFVLVVLASALWFVLRLRKMLLNNSSVMS